LSGTLTFSELPKFLEKVARKLDVPITAFDNLELVFMYDFAGDGALEFKEAYTLVKDKLARYRKTLGGHPVIHVPEKTPEEAGFTVIKVMGTGGQGTAKLVKDKHDKEKVLKVYPKGSTNATSLADLQEEMEHMLKARHSNIAVCHEIFQDAKHLYMVNDAYMGGDLESLQQRAAEQGIEQTEEWYLCIFQQAFAGLDFLHRSCIVHCDIKEPNIMVKRAEYESPKIVIIDLGMAGALQPVRGVCGTPGYMPPETWSYGAWFPRGDVFSMGVVCFQMLTNCVPNQAIGRLGLFQRGCRSIPEVAQATKTLEPPFRDLAHYSQQVMEWLPACLAKDFRVRPKPAEVLAKSWFQDADSDVDWQERLSDCCSPASAWFAWLRQPSAQ